LISVHLTYLMERERKGGKQTHQYKDKDRLKQTETDTRTERTQTDRQTDRLAEKQTNIEKGRHLD